MFYTVYTIVTSLSIYVQCLFRMHCYHILQKIRWAEEKSSDQILKDIGEN